MKERNDKPALSTINYVMILLMAGAFALLSILYYEWGLLRAQLNHQKIELEMLENILGPRVDALERKLTRDEELIYHMYMRLREIPIPISRSKRQQPKAFYYRTPPTNGKTK